MASITLSREELLQVKYTMEHALAIINKKLTLREEESKGGGLSKPSTRSKNPKKPLSAETLEQKWARKMSRKTIAS